MKLRTTLIVGVGSSHGDDQTGWRIANLLRKAIQQPGVWVRTASSPIQLLDWLTDVDRLIVCDACHGLGEVGATRRWEWPSSDLVQAEWAGSHDLSLPAVLRLAQQLGRQPDQVVIYAVEGGMRDPGGGMSPAVVASLPRLMRMIMEEVRQPQSARCDDA